MIGALVLAPLAFAGGDIGDLARAVSRWSHAPTVALVQAQRARPRGGGPSAADVADLKKRLGITVFPIGPEWKPAAALPAFEISTNTLSNPKDFARLIRVKTRLESRLKEGGYALWDASWQPSTTFIEGGGIPLPDGWQVAKPSALRLADGKATFGLAPHEAVRAEKVAALGWSKPVRVHWLLGQLWVVPVATGAGEKETLGALAAAVSGKFVETKEEYRIEFDPVAFRPRAQALIASRPPSDPKDPLEVAGFEIAQRTWYQIDDATITALFAEPYTGLSRPVKAGTPLATAMGQYLAALRRWIDNAPPERRSTADAYDRMLSRIDPEGEPRIVITQNLGASGGWPRVGGGTIMP